MNWMEIAVTVSSEGEEAVTDLFYRIGSKGVVVEALELIKEYIDSGIWDYHIFGDVEPTGKCIIKGYFPEDERLPVYVLALREELLLLQEQNPDWIIESETIMVKEEDWANEWKKYFKPIQIGKQFLIKPTWEIIEESEYDENILVIEIDPGMAFGTGTHPTTSLCLKAIEDHVQKGSDVFDIGTGSGILAVAAAKRGANVQAGDIDPLSVKIALENVSLNKVNHQVQVQAGNLGEVFTGQADVVIANIIADVIIELIPDLKSLMKDDGIFMASGIIDNRAEDVIRVMQEYGLEVVESREESGWVLICARQRVS